MANAKTREASLIIFLAAANITVLGIGGVFWGRVIGLVAYPVLNGRLPQQTLKSTIEPTSTNKRGV
ncbi:MAG: benzoate/H(+) symporter BenE family transporter [Azonexus sp.]|nr:benzoate/H(+) symporter BenE family transporter [Azonexus sp.]